MTLLKSFRILCTIALTLLGLQGWAVAAQQPGAASPVPAEASAVPAETAPVMIDAQAAMTNTLTQYGITWTFDRVYEYGQFANGDYWVLGPVTITRIEPDAIVDYHNLGSGICTGESAGVNACVAAVSEQYPGYDPRCTGVDRGTGDCTASSVENGWEVNPVVAGAQGFQSGCSGGTLDASLVPDLPYTSPTSGTVSIVKIIPTGDARPCIKVAAVLTVVTEPPPGNGAAVFRPPYVGTDKPYYYVADLRTDLLPSYAPVGTPPSLDYIEERFRRLRLDHKGGVLGRSLRPADAMDDYQPANAPDLTAGVLRFMLDTGEDIMPALIQYVQAGIDRVYTILDGQTWPAGGGHQPAHLLPAAFTATLLDIAEVKDVLRAADFFHATTYLASQTAEGVQLWGENSSEAAYWAYVISEDGSRSNKDPYGYIDGGKPGSNGLASYQNITSQAHKGEVLAADLMPVLKDSWPLEDLAYATNYAERFVSHGGWFLPDPCAPYTSTGTYGVDYGPDPGNPGMCILDEDLAYYNGPTDFACLAGHECGRFPDRHGLGADEGQYRSAFVAAMWDAYYGSGTLSLTLNATPSNRAVHLNWTVAGTLPPTGTWTINYESPGTVHLPVTGILSHTRAYTLIDLTNYVWYTVTLNAMLDTTPILTDTVRVMPTDRFVYLPLVLR
ncbi:MAG: hypothetical protein JXA21_21040 [Anaerolineae bacterium]|nr:hypothetical protein [Anaerolineae bacterium]